MSDGLVRVVRETKVFDPRDAGCGAGGVELVDASVVWREGRWWLFLAGQPGGFGATDIFSACLPVGAELGATGWSVVRGAEGKLSALAGNESSAAWDGRGGRHCPAYVKGFDAAPGKWVERIYYAGAAKNLWGPYAIGFLEWDGARWVDFSAPVFAAEEEWERGSVFEPNLIYHDGKWKMWYVAGSHGEDYLVHGYAESVDGRSWGARRIFAPAEMKMFDFCVRERGDGKFDAIFSRVWVRGGAPPAETGLWWCRAAAPSGKLEDWGSARQILTAEDRGWHSGTWKPSFASRGDGDREAVVFFDGSYIVEGAGPFPFVFTLGCLEVELEES
jgi:hypothetical protein